jgi:hypothetical protein
MNSSTIKNKVKRTFDTFNSKLARQRNYTGIARKHQEETTKLNNLLPKAVVELHPAGLANCFGYFVN